MYTICRVVEITIRLGQCIREGQPPHLITFFSAISSCQLAETVISLSSTNFNVLQGLDYRLE